MDKLKATGKMSDELIATELLVSAKATVRTYAVALTETASPQVREILKKQLNEAIDNHAKIANYMIKNNMYYAYDVDKQLEHDKEKLDQSLELVK
ncbi:spore coat protein [Niallia circulans]|uniref:Spore coat protein n=2 Tax=Bacillaceae TaxID=186817 RepID=A0A268FCE2_NIACI|nr:spore coat protein [Niallia circulans]AYV74878.1 spore coat protein [Niallia circulans]NRG29269.1 spore coat protein [Niallia circulans]PAD83031.1 spore coat protein [Niallia circulans]